MSKEKNGTWFIPEFKPEYDSFIHRGDGKVHYEQALNILISGRKFPKNYIRIPMDRTTICQTKFWPQLSDRFFSIIICI